MLFLFVRLAFAGCPATSGDIDTSLDEAEAAFTSMDTETFGTSVRLAMEEAACLNERPQRATVARLHRIVGLRVFVVEKDNARASAAFAAARTIESAYTFPVTFVPPKHPVAELFATATDSGASETVPAPRSGHLEFDGRVGTERPMSRPALAQVVAEDGSVKASAYVWPGEALPAYEVAGTLARADLPPKHRKGPNVPLAIVASASLVGTGVIYAVNYDVNQTYWDPETPDSEREALKATNNALVIADVGVGVLALTAGIGAVVAGHW